MGRPEIRFKGYTDEWEQRKLIEVCDYVDYRGKTPTKTENGIFLVTAKNVKDGFIDYETSKEYISENAYEEVMRRGKPEIGDVLITTEAPCGNVAQVNKADIALAQRIIKYRGHIGVVDNTYLKYYLLSPEFQKILNAKSSGGTVQGIKGSILHQQKIIYPSYEEQKKIGQHMDSLDHLITLHQRKCDEVKSLKKYMLQKMFPQNEQKVPEIRFEGFTEAWEQRKVGELLEERNEQAPMSEDYPLMAFIANQGVAPKGERYDRSALVNDETGKKYKRTEFGDFIYSSNNLETGSIGLNKYGNACISPVYSIFKPTGKAELDFLGRRFLRKDFINEMVRWRQGVVYGQWKIHETDFMKIEVKIPSIDEQKKIGQYFDSLDNLITLHQRKCDELQELKKYMLQNMFPQKG